MSPDGTETSALLQVPAEALDAAAGLLQRRRRGGVGDAERRSEPEGRALHHGDAFVLQELGDEILVGFELLAGQRGLAHGPAARPIALEHALPLRPLHTFALLAHP